MVDVFVRAFKSPQLGVGGKVGSHVLMDFLLQVKAKGAQGADDDVGTDAAFHGDIPSRIRQLFIAGVVFGGHADLLAGKGWQPQVGLCREGRQEDEEEGG